MSFGSDFLALPDFFPERLSGENCGNARLRVPLFGGPYDFDGLQAEWIPTLRKSLRRHDEDVSGPPSLETSVFIAHSADFLERDVRGWEYSLEFDYHPWGIRIAGLSWMARLELGAQMRGAIWTSARSPDEVYGVIENYLRIVTAYRCLELGGMLIHSAAVSVGDRAWVFYGKSGAGKSTLSRLALENDLEVLSDDLNVLAPEPGMAETKPHWQLAIVPFTGDLDPSPRVGEKVRLHSVNRLEKSKTHRLEPLGSAECLASLIAVCPYVNRDPHRQTKLIENLGRLDSIQKKLMAFAPNADVFDSLNVCQPSHARAKGTNNGIGH